MDYKKANDDATLNQIEIIEAYRKNQRIHKWNQDRKRWDTFSRKGDELIGYVRFFDFRTSQYRLTEPDTCRPWKFEECPVGAVLRKKINGDECVILCKRKLNKRTENYIVRLGGCGCTSFVPQTLLEHYVLVNRAGEEKPAGIEDQGGMV